MALSAVASSWSLACCDAGSLLALWLLLVDELLGLLVLAGVLWAVGELVDGLLGELLLDELLLDWDVL
ncbi:hypothetical protein [Porticoccus sp.]